MRAPPAYQEYPSDMLANENFRLMSLEERGLLYCMRLTCWTNQSIPSDPARLASVLGVPVDSLSAALTKAVRSFFISCDEDPGRLISPELRDYRAGLEELRLKKSGGGKKGAKARWAKEKNRNGSANGSAIPLAIATAEKIKDQVSRRGGSEAQRTPFTLDDEIEVEEYKAAFARGSQTAAIPTENARHKPVQ